MGLPIVCSCGSKLFERAIRTGGWWKELIDENGEVVETNLDSVKYGSQPKTVKCAECGKTNRNPNFGDE